VAASLLGTYATGRNRLSASLEYIHFNPVKHGYVKAPMDWPYSSFWRYVKTGVYPPDWGGNVQEVEGVGRE
jgi:putative transposase